MYRDHFMSGDDEPWRFRGGLQAEFQVCIAQKPAYCPLLAHVAAALLHLLKTPPPLPPAPYLFSFSFFTSNEIFFYVRFWRKGTGA